MSMIHKIHYYTFGESESVVKRIVIKSEGSRSKPYYELDQDKGPNLVKRLTENFRLEINKVL